MREINTPCVPFDVLLFYHWERCEKVDHVRHRRVKEWSPIDFLPVHILQVSFGDCRPLAALQLTRGKDMEVLHKNVHNPGSYTGPSFDVLLTPQKHAVL